ncbi:precorrin-6Y C5,15-methyltransferase (decarboxylating) subunit CbiT [Desulfotomaculum copahuensis]|uniref:Precorrin-6Y C5,15-methyltransferase (Decarboxylating) subunit CbiT n=1 Tax=Desulfotomaculum copahuensis TaxID=1838280 RepID=A0A1B7LC88_9FIRM|nr:precorrin-6Y C5,15-methyltransferase (decarboxylating) subunit CbiT [Desulfotomaculum copahuensis]OAT80270.1 precorrin-6Y C5,15-methyltransferase (decarboxylating) subunit CbiT [Desulfotomaculum copahuensis]
MNSRWPFLTPGIPDDLFVRNKVPMTKEEIRVVTLAKARLAPDQIVWDVGSGTGSLAVEAARLIGNGMVCAVERNPDGVKLIEANARRFELHNIRVVAGAAPQALHGLPAPDRVLVGGSGGQLAAIVTVVDQVLHPGGRLVINAVTLETLAGALACLNQPWRVEVVQVSAARAEQTGKSHLLRALNPVFIISAWKGDA